MRNPQPGYKSVSMVTFGHDEIPRHRTTPVSGSAPQLTPVTPVVVASPPSGELCVDASVPPDDDESSVVGMMLNPMHEHAASETSTDAIRMNHRMPASLPRGQLFGNLLSDAGSRRACRRRPRYRASPCRR